MTAAMEAHVVEGAHRAVSHVAAESEDGNVFVVDVWDPPVNVFVVDVWDSPESFRRFAETKLGPAGAQVGTGPLEL